MSASSLKTALVTNTTGFAGSPAVSALLEAGFHVLAQDASLGSEHDWDSFSEGRARLEPIAESPAGCSARRL